MVYLRGSFRPSRAQPGRFPHLHRPSIFSHMRLISLENAGSPDIKALPYRGSAATLPRPNLPFLSPYRRLRPIFGQLYIIHIAVFCILKKPYFFGRFKPLHTVFPSILHYTLLPPQIYFYRSLLRSTKNIGTRANYSLARANKKTGAEPPSKFDF